MAHDVSVLEATGATGLQLLERPPADSPAPRAFKAPVQGPVRDFYIVSLRKEQASSRQGRHNLLMSLRNGLPGIGGNPIWVSFKTPRLRTASFVLAAMRWLFYLVAHARMLPLQSMLALQSGLEMPRRAHSGAAPVIFIDGIRLAFLGPSLRRRLGGRLIVDFDDLMSRRARGMIRRGTALSFGAFEEMLPAAVRGVMDGAKAVQRLLFGLEKHLLRAAERRAAREADAIAFTSPYEARLFSRYLRRFAPDVHPQLLVLGPTVSAPLASPADIRRRPAPEHVHFIFIGWDLLEQNRVAIDGLLALARAGALPAPAHIYGKTVRAYDAPPGVTFHGLVKDLGEVYRPGAIMLIARSIPGGIKTKIIEAIEHGVPTIATSVAMEGLSGRYPWKGDDAAIAALLSDPERLKAQYNEALALGVEICARQFSPQRYWGELESFASTGSIASAL